MWLLLFLLTGLNATLDNNFVNGNMRLYIGGFPANIFDVVIFILVLASLLPKGEGYFRTERPHPCILWAIGLFVLAVLGAGFGAMGNGATARQITTVARNLIEMPIIAFLGYRLLPRLRSAVTHSYVLIVAGLVVTNIILWNFGDQAQTLNTGSEITNVRVVQFISNYAGIAAALILFSLGSGAKPLAPPWLAVLLASYLFVGMFATLSRSDWLAMCAGIVAAIVVMPKYRTMPKIIFTVVTLPVMAIVLFGAILVASSISGKDVKAKMVERFETMLPGESDSGKAKAWDTRLSSTIEELGIWVHSPIIGGGFGIQDVRTAQDGLMGYRHNSWSGTLAESGLLGFAAMGLLCIGPIVVGRRMIRDRLDRSTLLMGGLGVITGVHYIVHGYCTMSFNQVRWGMPLALTFGVVMRARAMQLATQEHYAGYLPDATEHRDATPIIDDMALPTY